MTDANDSSARMLGYADHSQLLGVALDDLLEASGDRSGWYGCRLRAKGGQRIEAICRESGGLIHLAPVEIGSISHRLQLTSLLESTSDGILMFDADLYITSCNRGWEQLYGTPASWVVGRHFSELFFSPVADALMGTAMHDAFAGKTRQLTTRLPSFNGPLIDVSILIAPVYEANQLLGFSVISRDVTGDLDVQRRLRQKQRELDQAEGMLRLIVNLLSHDLRAPLSSITLCAQMIADSSGATLDVDDRNALKMIISEGAAAQERISRILSYQWRSSSLRVMDELGPARTDARIALDIALQTTQTDDCEIEIGQLPELSIPCSQQTLIFQALLGSSIQSADRPRIKITQQPSANPFWSDIHWTDNGISLAERDRQFVSPARSPADTELGISDVIEIVEAHGGHVDLSEDSHSVTFILKVPLFPLGARASGELN